GFEFDTLNLDHQDVPGDAYVLMIPDPKSALSEQKLERINNYVNNGGNLLLMSELRKQDILNPVAKTIGAEFMRGSLVQLTKNESPDKIFPYMSIDFPNMME